MSNLPPWLPQGSLLIFDDSTPFANHDCDSILNQLCNAVQMLNPDALLLDFQRPGVPEVQALVQQIVTALPCPVAVSSSYASNLDCPIFLPPGPLNQPLSDYLRPYKGRVIWLDAAPVYGQILVTSDGAQYSPHYDEAPDTIVHADTQLHCHYQTKIEENRVVFNLFRNRNDLILWLEEAGNLGVSCAVGLLHELSFLFP